MKVGDLLIDFNDKKWIIFDVTENFYYVLDFETQKVGEVLITEMIKEHIEKPANVEVLQLRRRQKIMEALGLDKFIS